MDGDWKKEEERCRVSYKMPEDAKIGKDLDEYLVERARLRGLWWDVRIFILAMAGFGVSLKIYVACPMVLPFISRYKVRSSDPGPIRDAAFSS